MPDTDRTARLLALMNEGDVAFNARDVAGMDAVHHPDLIAYITGNADPVYGRAAHAEAVRHRVRPDLPLGRRPAHRHLRLLGLGQQARQLGLA